MSRLSSMFMRHPLRRSLSQKSIPRNAIADGANSAVTCASAQGNHLGFADKEAATPTNGARADSLAYERRIQKCRSLRGGKREQRSRECERTENFTHTHPPRHWLPQSWFYKRVSSVGPFYDGLTAARRRAERFLGLLAARGSGCALRTSRVSCCLITLSSSSAPASLSSSIIPISGRIYSWVSSRSCSGVWARTGRVVAERRWLVMISPPCVLRPDNVASAAGFLFLGACRVDNNRVS